MTPETVAPWKQVERLYYTRTFKGKVVAEIQGDVAARWFEWRVFYSDANTSEVRGGESWTPKGAIRAAEACLKELGYPLAEDVPPVSRFEREDVV